MTASFRTARLSLRLVRLTDRQNLVALERDPEVMRFLSGGCPISDDGADESAGFLTPRGGEGDVWTAAETLSAAFVGWFSLRRVREGRAELGYRLRRAAWGRGYASEGTKGRYRFPFGDFSKVNRAALIHAKQRAAQNDHGEVEAAADRLLQRIDG